MRQQSSEVVAAERTKYFAAVLRHERVAAAVARGKRLVQMPARCKQVRQLRPAHESGVIAVPARDLLHSASKQHHVVGGCETRFWRKGELALARTELHLDRTQRQAKPKDVAPDDLKRRLHQVVTLLGQILISLRQKAHRGRLPRLAGVLRRHAGVVQFEDVEFDLEPGEEVITAIAELLENRAVEMSRRKRN